MDSTPALTQDAVPPLLFTGVATAGAMLKQQLLQALAAGVPTLSCLDADFVHWPLADAELLQALLAWAMPGRRLRLLARDYEALRVRHPRFLLWRQRHAHLVDARQFEDDGGLLGGEMAPAALFLGAPPIVWRLWDWRSGRGTVVQGEADHAGAQAWFDAISQRSAESFASTTLGL